MQQSSGSDEIQSLLQSGDYAQAYWLLNQAYEENRNDVGTAEALIHLQRLFLSQLSAQGSQHSQFEVGVLRASISFFLLANYSALLQQKLRRSHLSCVILGEGGAISSNQELFSDFGMRIAGYALRSASFYSQTDWDLTQIPWNEIDVVIVAPGNPADEAAICERLTQDARFQMDPRPVYRSQWIEQAFAAALAAQAENRSCLNIRKLALVGLIAALSKSGPIIECGAYRCGTSAFLGALQRHWKSARHVHAIDTFAGMPQPVAKDGGTVYQAGTFTGAELNECTRFIRERNLDTHVTLHKGLVQDVLPVLAEQLIQCRFLFSDTDQYSGTMASLEPYLPLMRPDSFVIVDDYSLEGVQRAVRELRDRWPDFDGFELTTNFFVGWRGLTSNGLSMLSLR